MVDAVAQIVGSPTSAFGLGWDTYAVGEFTGPQANDGVSWVAAKCGPAPNAFDFESILPNSQVIQVGEWVAMDVRHGQFATPTEQLVQGIVEMNKHFEVVCASVALQERKPDRAEAVFALPEEEFLGGAPPRRTLTWEEVGEQCCADGDPIVVDLDLSDVINDAGQNNTTRRWLWHGLQRLRITPSLIEVLRAMRTTILHIGAVTPSAESRLVDEEG